MHILRSFQHYWRWHLALAVGVALAAMAIVGSLLVGDSVKATLAERAGKRLQGISHAVSCGDSFLNLAAVQRLQSGLPQAVVAPVLLLPGTVSASGGGKRVNGVKVYGVDENFWKLAQGGGSARAASSGLLVNEALAARLGAKLGQEIIVRVEKPSLISRDAPLSGESEAMVSFTEPLEAVVADAELGCVNLAAEQSDALNVFLPLHRMAKAVEATRQIAGKELPNLNLILTNSDQVATALQSPQGWNLEEANMDLFEESSGQFWVLKTGRIFLADQVLKAAEAAGLQPQSVFTYLNTELRGDADHYTAYPLVTGLAGQPGLLAKPLVGQEMAVNQWTADSLQLKVGDSVALTYYSLTEGRNLKEESANFKIREVLPMDSPLMTGVLTPDIPGFSQATSCRDWKSGIVIKQQGFIRREDEQYWKDRKTTPKAFISLSRAQELWRNRFGQATSLWIPKSQGSAAEVQAKLQSQLNLGDLGFAFVPARAQAQAAVDESMDFSGLFIAMSFFLIATALVLVALLFLYNVEGRAGQIGLLRAAGFTAGAVRNLFLKEFFLTLLLGAGLGIPLARLYQVGILQRLSGDWGGAVNGLKFISPFHAGTVALGWGLTVVMGLFVLWWTSRRLAKVQPAQLLAGATLHASQPEKKISKKGGFRWAGLIGYGLIGLAVIMAAAVVKMDRNLQPGLFFGAAALLLMGGLRVLSDRLQALEQNQSLPPRSTWTLGLRQAVRRRGRSLAVAGLLAAGVFMVSAMNTLNEDARKNGSPGTGGFAFLATSDTAIVEDLNSPTGQDLYGLETVPAKFVAFRKRPGEEASCLNLNKAQVPSVLGVDESKIADAGKFEFAGTWSGVDSQGMRSPWELLKKKLPDGAIPAIVDLNSALWALKKKLGDLVEVPNGQGGTAKLQLVAFLKNTVLQGHVIISENNFASQFPDSAGYKLFLVTAPVEGRAAVATKITRQLQSKGVALESTEDHLAQLQAVQNAYLQIFSSLGGLGLLLSTAALGLLIGRNVLERQGELALMVAAGFTKQKIRQVVLAEFLPLFLVAFLLGIMAAALAVWPHLRDGTGAIPLAMLGKILGGMVVAGVLFCLGAAWLALRKQTLTALRQE